MQQILMYRITQYVTRIFISSNNIIRISLPKSIQRGGEWGRRGQSGGAIVTSEKFWHSGSKPRHISNFKIRAFGR